MSLLPSLNVYVSILVFGQAQFLVLASIAFCATEFAPNPWRERSRLHPKKIRFTEVFRQCKSSVFNLFVQAFVLALGSSVWMREHGAVYNDVKQYGWPYLLLSILVLFFIHDSWFYWLHRSMHSPFLYRHFHHVHHRLRQPSPYGVYSFHPIEMFFHAVWILPVIYFLPYHVYALIGFTFLTLIFNIQGHLGYEILPERTRNMRILNCFSMTLHHDNHHVDCDGNFGLYLLFWDRLMDTKVERKTALPQEAAASDLPDRLEVRGS